MDPPSPSRLLLRLFWLGNPPSVLPHIVLGAMAMPLFNFACRCRLCYFNNLPFKRKKCCLVSCRFSFWFFFCVSGLDLVFFSGYLVWQSWPDGAAFSILHSAFAFWFQALFFFFFFFWSYGRRHCVSWTFFGQNTFESWLGDRQVGRHLGGLAQTLIGKFFASAYRVLSNG